MWGRKRGSRLNTYKRAVNEAMGMNQYRRPAALAKVRSRAERNRANTMLAVLTYIYKAERALEERERARNQRQLDMYARRPLAATRSSGRPLNKNWLHETQTAWAVARAPVVPKTAPVYRPGQAARSPSVAPSTKLSLAQRLKEYAEVERTRRALRWAPRVPKTVVPRWRRN